MSGYYLKNPDSHFDYSFDWSLQGLEASETIATDLGWSVHNNDTGSGSLTIETTSSTTTTTTARISGGVPGSAYLLCSKVQTSGGRTVQRALTVRIANT